jgi:hypothetical protein
MLSESSYDPVGARRAAPESDCPMRFLAAVLLVALPALAADPAEGRKLVEEKRCENCHHNQTMGDAKAVYLRKDRRVTSMEKLKSQVAVCNSQLKLQLFPEDEEHIVAYLNDTYYHFGKK